MTECVGGVCAGIRIGPGTDLGMRQGDFPLTDP
jgi:hypothetical protein